MIMITTALTLYPVSRHWNNELEAGKMIRPLFLCNSYVVIPHVDNRLRSNSN